ncbi:MAG: thioredoxin [Paramuribaculum sp.]|nr:thioredoxin [Paramuribaculum sp.]MDE5920300.1 thioredoxin [Paramuribaculum sp.]
MAIKFTDSDVKSIIASGEPVVIDFWATWCGPCMRMSPVIDELAEQYDGRVHIGKYNIEEETELSDEYRIMSIPTILFFKNGQQIRDLRLAGSQSKAKLEENINALLAL